MSVILEPNIEAIGIDSIEFEMDENNESGALKIMEKLGSNIPLIKIGNYILGMGDLENLVLRVALNSLTSFTLTINDEQYKIREMLKKDIDVCTIVLGFYNSYIKFHGLLNTTFSEVGDTIIEVTGNVFNRKLYDTKQKGYTDKNLTDILEDICSSTNMGLFTDENNNLTTPINNVLRVGQNNLEYIDWLVRNYTTNVYCIDYNYFVHIVDLTNIKDKPYDKYSFLDGEKLDGEYDIIFKSKNQELDPEIDEHKILVEYYSIDTNFSNTQEISKTKYDINYVGLETEKIETESDKNIGNGKKSTNSFSGFKNQKNPYYDSIVNKKLAGNVIKIQTYSIMFDLPIFGIVGFECYLPIDSEHYERRLDEEHSGKKIVISNTLEYTKADKNNTRPLTQIIELI